MVVLWIAILALKDKDHMVRASIPGLAGRAKISVEDCERYLRKMEGPDKYSQNQAHEGRRLKRVDGGWFVLNGGFYQDFLAKEQRNEAVAKAMQRYRARKKSKPKPL